MYFFLSILTALTYCLVGVETQTTPLIKRPISQPLLPPPKRVKIDIDDVEFADTFNNLGLTKKPLDPAGVSARLGHGGTYESVRTLASKDKAIESDHAPHFSLLDYLDLDKVDQKALPDKLKSALETRRRLQDELSRTDHAKNAAEMKIIQGQMNTLDKELNKPIPVSKWKDKALSKGYTANNKEITRLLKENKQTQGLLDKLPPGATDPVLENKINQNQATVADLQTRNSELRRIAEEVFRTPGKQAKLNKLKEDYNLLDGKNKELSKALDAHNSNIKNAMGVLSIPYDKHRIFPSTGNVGLDDEVRALKTADVPTAEKAMKEYSNAWISNMEEGIKKGYLKNSDDFAMKTKDGIFVLDSNGKKIYDHQKIWESNFETVIHDSAESKSAKGKKAIKTPEQLKFEFMNRLRTTYAKKFITTAIYFVKTPEAGYTRLMGLYLSEYKIYLGNDFDTYKLGMQKLLETNKASLGWLNDAGISKLKADFKLTDILSDTTTSAGLKKQYDWNEVEELIKKKADNSKNPFTATDPTTASSHTTAATVCSTSNPTGRRRRSASFSGTSCIFFSKPNTDENVDKQTNPDTNVDKNNPKIKPANNADFDGTEGGNLPKSKISLPSSEATVAIDSKRLGTLLADLDKMGDMDSIRTKDAVVEYAIKNQDKLIGSDEDVARTKALLQQHNLDSAAEQNSLARNVLRNTPEVSPRGISNYQKVKISMSNFAKKASKFTSATDKFGGSYGKIMLAKGAVTALRHGDFTSLAIMGGRIGLDFGLKGVEKLGTFIAKKASTKFVTKLGSNVLGKMAGPVGAIADVGLNVWSITKSVKILNDPNASKYDQNDAIADIVADSIDIAITVTAAVLSLVFPPLAPVFAAVALIINILTTLVVGFFKAANHVDRINSEIPLLGYEKRQETFRYFTGSETSGYIQDLIDTKKANNIAVNLTVQFLINNPDYIGRIFPARTMYDPQAECNLQKKVCTKWLHFIPSCSGWEHLSSCDGYGGYCSGGQKCQSDSGTGAVVPIIGHETTDYRCQCGPDPPPVWGFEIPDSVVDLSKKILVHLQRAAPDFEVPSGFGYICKPSSLGFEGDRVSKRDKEYAYLCQGAIGVERRGRVGKFMLYDLGTGNDRITLDTSDKTDNLFLVKDGQKDFTGNGGDDTFHFDGPCDQIIGNINGLGLKSLGNSLVLGQNCSTYRSIEVDLVSNTANFGGVNSNVKVYNIQRVIGRTNLKDVIIAGCSTTLVVGGGGGDKISIPSCGSQSNFDMILVAEGRTGLDASKFFTGKLYTLIKGHGNQFTATVPNQFEGSLLFKFENVGGLSDAKISNNNQIVLEFMDGGKAEFTIAPGTSLPALDNKVCRKGNSGTSAIAMVIQNENFQRQLLYNLESASVQCAITIENKASKSSFVINGYTFLENIFSLSSGHWQVFGGNKNDQFYLTSLNFSGSLDGGNGQNSLHITEKVHLGSGAVLNINLQEGFIRSTKGEILLSDLQNVFGTPQVSETVTASCTTQYLVLGGLLQDRLEIPDLKCSPRITITASGKLVIVDRKINGTTIIQAGYEKQDSCSNIPVSNLELSLSNFGSEQTVLQLNYPMNKLQSASTSLLKFVGGNSITLSGTFPEVNLEEEYDLKSALVVDNGQIIGFHELRLSGNSPKINRCNGEHSSPERKKVYVTLIIWSNAQ